MFSISTDQQLPNKHLCLQAQKSLAELQNRYFKLSTKSFSTHTSVTDIHKGEIPLQAHKKILHLSS
jgi:uncharacterized protein YxeA